MRSPEIVVVEELGESEGSVYRGWVGSVISPAAQEGLDKAFGFSIGARTVGPGTQVTQTELSACRSEAMRDVAGAVVGHDACDINAAAGVPGDQPSKEDDSRWRSFVSQDLGVSQTGSVVHGNMEELPTGTSGALPTVAGDAVADELDATQLLDVDVDELSGVVPLIAVNGLLGVEVLEPRQAFSSQDAGHSGRTQAHSGGDLGSCLPTPAQPDDLFHNHGMGLTRRTTRPRAAIDQCRLAGLLISAFPFRSGSAVNTGRLGGAGHGDACLDALDHQHSTGRTSSGILVKLHLGSFGRLLALSTSSLTDLAQIGNYFMGITC